MSPYKPKLINIYIKSFRFLYLLESGAHLLSRAVTHQVSSAVQVLTVVFGMGTGVSPERISTENIVLFCTLKTENKHLTTGCFTQTVILLAYSVLFALLTILG